MKRRLKKKRKDAEWPAWLLFQPKPRPGPWLASWLNNPRTNRGSKQRVKHLIELLRAWREQLETYPDNRDSARRAHELSDEVEKLVQRYQKRPAFLAPFMDLGPGVHGREILAWSRPVDEDNPEEWQAVEALQQLVTEQKLDRLACCLECGKKWVFRSRSNHLYCTERCRQSRYEATPERKKQRREYMREYMREYHTKGRAE